MDSSIPKKMFYGLLAIILLLLLLNIGSYLNVYNNSLSENDFFFKKTSFGKEKNLPSIFSSLLHFTASFILALISFTNLKIRNRRIFWRFLSFLMFFVGLDELLRIHEKLGKYLSSSGMDSSGIFHYSWILPYGIAVILIGILCIKPIFELPRKTTLKIILAGIIFITGAVGVEMATGFYISETGIDDMYLYRIPEIFVISTIEELLEMIGVSYFIYALLDFREQYKIIQLPEKRI